MATEIAHITMAMAVIIVQTVMMMPLAVLPPHYRRQPASPLKTKASVPLPPPISR
ncbi:hypothetical protein [Dongia sp.]|uniref:hypothetical protein n=1 Tax=Dongia sp. TaxID=1977262 RepID=UPI0035B494BA